MKRLLLIAVATLAACTTAQEIKRPGGASEFLIACASGLGWKSCYDKANKVCPSGYTTLNKDDGFRELEIQCAPAPTGPTPTPFQATPM